MGCFNCEWCRIGEYRHCEATDWRTNPNGRRYGYTSADNPGRLWGGFSEYMYLPWNAVLHRVPETITAESQLGDPAVQRNRVGAARRRRWIQRHGAHSRAGTARASQVVACKQGGASKIIVTGTTRDKVRLDLARELGADHVIDILQEDPFEKVLDLTAGRGVDFVLDCTSRAGTAPVLLGVDALKRREGTLLIQGELAAFPDFPVKKLTEKAITIKSARGHSYKVRARAWTARIWPVPAGTARDPSLRDRPGGPRDPRARRRDRRGRGPHLADARDDRRAWRGGGPMTSLPRRAVPRTGLVITGHPHADDAVRDGLGAYGRRHHP